METRPAFPLEPGERLLWSGTQVYGRRARRRRLFSILFFLFFTGFAAFWTFAATGFGRFAGPWWMASVGLLFVALGLFQLYRLVLRPWRPDADYAATDRRILVLNRGKPRSLVALTYAEFGEPEAVLHGDGLGDVLFPSTLPTWSDPTGYRRRWEQRSGWPAFLSIARPEEALTAIRDARAGKPAPPAAPRRGLSPVPKIG